jgi:hypothetical protein
MKNLTRLTLIIGMIGMLLACGKYEDGPLLSVRTKNARLEGEWKLTALEKVSTSDVFSSTQTLSNGIMTEISSGFSSSYAYSESWTITLNDNLIKMDVTEDGYNSIYTTYWNWENGSSSKELINIDGELYRIIKLSNKEMILEQNYASSTGTTVNSTLTFEKQ